MFATEPKPTNSFAPQAKPASVRSIVFFLFNFSQGPIREYYIYSLAPDLKTITTFYSFIQIRRNPRPLLRYVSLYPVNQLEHVFENLKYDFKQIWIWTSFDRSLSLITPI